MDQIVACIQIHGDGVELENIFTLVGKDIARTTLNVWKARNNRDPCSYIFRGLKTHRPYCVKHNHHANTIVSSKILWKVLKNTCPKMRIWDHFRVKLYRYKLLYENAHVLVSFKSYAAIATCDGQL